MSPGEKSGLIDGLEVPVTIANLYVTIDLTRNFDFWHSVFPSTRPAVAPSSKCFTRRASSKTDLPCTMPRPKTPSCASGLTPQATMKSWYRSCSPLAGQLLDPDFFSHLSSLQSNPTSPSIRQFFLNYVFVIDTGSNGRLLWL
jgi:hypothetical protein